MFQNQRRLRLSQVTTPLIQSGAAAETKDSETLQLLLMWFLTVVLSEIASRSSESQWKPLEERLVHYCMNIIRRQIRCSKIYLT